MATPIFPSELPVVSRFVTRPVESVLTDEENGRKDFRRRSSSNSAIADVEWNLISDDYLAFENFRSRTLLGAHKWFWMKLPSAGGVTWHVVRFGENKPSARMNGLGAWIVSAQIEILNRQFEQQPDPQPYPDLLGFKFYFTFSYGGG